MSATTRFSFERLGNALDRLDEILQCQPDANRAYIDASIQRFEFCIELFWKALKRLLYDLGKDLTFPKEILQEAYQGHLIDDEQAWLMMLKDRNQASHTYHEGLADEVYENIKNSHYRVMRKAYTHIVERY